MAEAERIIGTPDTPGAGGAEPEQSGVEGTGAPAEEPRDRKSVV